MSPTKLKFYYLAIHEHEVIEYQITSDQHRIITVIKKRMRAFCISITLLSFAHFCISLVSENLFLSTKAIFHIKFFSRFSPNPTHIPPQKNKPPDYPQRMRNNQGANFIWSNGQIDIRGRFQELK